MKESIDVNFPVIAKCYFHQSVDAVIYLASPDIYPQKMSVPVCERCRKELNPYTLVEKYKEKQIADYKELLHNDFTGGRGMTPSIQMGTQICFGGFVKELHS